jgi:hypothetical protein
MRSITAKFKEMLLIPRLRKHKKKQRRNQHAVRDLRIWWSPCEQLIVYPKLNDYARKGFVATHFHLIHGIEVVRKRQRRTQKNIMKTSKKQFIKAIMQDGDSEQAQWEREIVFTLKRRVVVHYTRKRF